MLNLHNELKQNVKINEKERKKIKKDCSHLDSGNMVHSVVQTILLQAYKFCSSVVLLGKELKN